MGRMMFSAFVPYARLCPEVIASPGVNRKSIGEEQFSDATHE